MMHETILRLIEIPFFSVIIYLACRYFFRGSVVYRAMLFAGLFALWCGEGTALCYPYGDKVWWARPALYTSELVFGVMLARYYVRLLRRPLQAAKARLERICSGDLREGDDALNGMQGEIHALHVSMGELQQSLVRILGEIQSSAGVLEGASSKLHEAAEELSAGATEQADSLGEVDTSNEYFGTECGGRGGARWGFRQRVCRGGHRGAEAGGEKPRHGAKDCGACGEVSHLGAQH